MQTIHDLDAKIVERCQNIYLWVFDWTGIYVATIMVVCVFLGQMIVAWQRGADWFAVAILMFNVTATIPNYLHQSHKQFTVYNMIAGEIAQLPLRFWFTFAYLVPFGILEAATGAWWWAINNVCVIMYMYFACVKIRDREPKEWFKRHKLVWTS